ncbi:MAG TPA: hypothetical protein VEK11_19060 [Thermoanaerobaculia bacterium]|jgi:hypothetical protein|nr:hypothetical protein [Thermoanaerobaculia bacterium]
MRSALFLLVLATPLAAQDNVLFPRFSLVGGSSASDFETNARIDPETSAEEGTLVSFENDLGLDDSSQLERFSVQWRPFARHELAATYFSAPRSGREQIDREIVFRNETYRAQALVTTQWDLDYASLTYTYWLRRGERDGFGLTLGAATLALDASVTAEREDESLTVTQEANTDVPVALVGLQGRVALTQHVLGEASVATLPRVTIEDYTGSALTASARIEYRPVRWLGIGAAYNYFRLDVDVEQLDLRGALDMTIRGPEAFVRLAF